MKKYNIYTYALFLLLLSAISCGEKPVRDLNPKALKAGFELLPSTQTGIDFNNQINETKTFNHFLFSQIYLGSGVAIGDINNDGLADVFFGGNQVSDRLYLNKGDFKFEDITMSSKIAKNSGWTWGVTMVDINADGFLDIYVSRNGVSEKKEDRRNQLYINNGDLTFTESAIQYGLGDLGFSTQAVFFDMDNDGDLDMYQVNQLADKKLLLINKIPKDQFKYFKDNLYRNDNGKFVEVSQEVGISRNVAYGLSVNASDFNNDGWMDLYVANDYSEPDFLYYNNGDGTFKDVTLEKLKHITQLSMGSDTGDINNDGHIDLITTDMTPEDHYRSKTNMASMSTERFNELVAAGAHYQYMANALQINTGMGHFSDIANMAGVAYTDWSWANLMMDADNDGLKDILISNGIKKDVDNNDFKNKLKNLDANTTFEDLFEYSKNAPSQKISNYAFKNQNGLKFQKVTKDWGLDVPSFSNGMAYADLDNDGDLDLVVNNIDDKAFVYKNKATGNFLKIKLKGSGKNKFGIGAKTYIYYKDQKQLVENILTRGYFSSVEPVVFFGLGYEKNIDKVEVIWTDGKVSTYTNLEANQVLIADYKDAKAPKNNVASHQPILSKVASKGIDFIHQENEFNDFKEEILLPHKQSENGPFLSVSDVNNDGLEDVFIGGAIGQSGVLYFQSKNKTFTKAQTQPWEAENLSEDLGSLFFDADLDGDLDLYIASGGSEYKEGNVLLQDRLYLNDGQGNFTITKDALPNIYTSTQCVKASDVDNDGDLDVFVGTRLVPGQYTYPATSYLLINNNGIFTKAPQHQVPDFEKIGMVTDAVFSDIDQDEDKDLIIVGEWMTIKVLQNNNGNFQDVSKNYGMDKSTRGIWWSITASDIDNDGDDDYIIGNLGKNNKFKASNEHPFKVYANDFDNNGTNDVVLAKFYKDDYVPVRGRECTSQQMPYVAEKFEDYHSFASSKLIDILPDDKVDDAIVYEIENFESIILINDNKKLIKKSLPLEVQVSPIKSTLVDDFNKDGIKDILVVGNHYGVEVETTRYDAGYGALLVGDGNNNFSFVPPNHSGFYVPYDSRNMSFVGENILVTSNDDKPIFFKRNH